MKKIKGSIVSLMILTLLVGSIAVTAVNSNVTKDDRMSIEVITTNSDPKPLWV